MMFTSICPAAAPLGICLVKKAALKNRCGKRRAAEPSNDLGRHNESPYEMTPLYAKIPQIKPYSK